MRGLASILLVLAVAVALLSLTQTYLNVGERSLHTGSYALELERDYYSKMDFRHSVLQALMRGASDGNTREERMENAAGELARLGEHLEGRGAMLWCGVIGDGERSILAGRISESKKALSCSSCWSTNDMTVVYSGVGAKNAKLVRKCLSFIDVDALGGKVGVSKGGLAYTKDPEVAAAQFGGEFAFGISYYDEMTGIGSVALVPEGTWVDYG